MEDVDIGSIVSRLVGMDGLLRGRLTSSFSLESLLDGQGIPVTSALNALGSIALSDGQIAGWSPIQKMAGFAGLDSGVPTRFRALTG